MQPQGTFNSSTLRQAFLPGVGHASRSVFCTVGLLLVWLLWLGIVSGAGWVHAQSSAMQAVLWLLLPSVPAAALDVWLRWGAPASLWQRLLLRQHGLYWWPAWVCVPWWLWAVVFWAAYLACALGWW